MRDKKADIIKLLLEYPQGLKAKEISKKLVYIEKKEVNQILYGNPNDFVSNDYVWNLTTIKSNEISYKKVEIKELNEKHIIPYNFTKDLESLDLTDFQRAINHAKELYENNLTYYVGDDWFGMVTSSEKVFADTVSEYIDRKDTEVEAVKKEKEQNSKIKKKKEDAIRNLCRAFNLGNDIYEYFVSQDISEIEAQQRILKIRYYEYHYPELKINVSNCIRMPREDFDRLIQDKFSKPIKKCFGDCSSCKRDVCVEKL